MGGGSGSFLKVLVNNMDVVAGYASVRAIETKSAVDDQQWLTYWVLYSFITLFELTFAPVLEWLPFWSYAKLFFNCWLVLPQFNGAAHVYEHFVRPMIVNQQVVNIWYIPKKDESSRPDDVISAAQRYIEQNGSKAFENLVNKVFSLFVSAETIVDYYCWLVWCERKILFWLIIHDHLRPSELIIYFLLNFTILICESDSTSLQ
ncbi:HVA22-like protein a isoform X2 [Miscanthus floridulus]|uniref:HVA22-like protein a isoform X2 n=1 Tax=Miscanthus floridulus TaxID=154761 RepID=UPI0034581420